MKIICGFFQDLEIARLYIAVNHSEPKLIDQHYSVAQVADLLRVHPQTVRQWYKRQGLRIQRVGKQGVRIASSALREFLATSNMRHTELIDGMDNCGSTAATRRPGSRKSNVNQRKEASGPTRTR